MKNKNIFLSVSMGLLLSLSAFASELCVGDAVVANMTNGHYDARVLELYNDGTALIQYSVDNTTQVVPVSNLSQPISSEDGFAVGQSVVANMSNGHYDARIIELYSDGTALIQYSVDNTTQVVATSRLSAPIYCESGCRR